MPKVIPLLCCAAGLMLVAAGVARGDDSCEPAIAAAEQRSHLPAGMLHAIGVVESGRRDPLTGRVDAWPFSVNAGGESRFFNGIEPAMDFVRDAWARGIRSIDVGCMQINLMYHPDAFASLRDAFAPEANVRYAADFLLALYRGTGDWAAAAGNYHSAFASLSLDYARRVRAVMGGGDLDGAAWRADAAPDRSIVLAGPAAGRVRVFGPGGPADDARMQAAARHLPVVYHPRGAG